jgi:uncharacterized protein YbjT (DUF2867 family)
MSTTTPSAADHGIRVLIAGATGLVGQQCLRLLLRDEQVQGVRVLVRRPMTSEALAGQGMASTELAKLDICVADFDRLDEHPDWFEVDWVFCALGTTIRVAGSQAAFKRVDFDYPCRIARLAKGHGARHFLLVSALGANASSKVFYNRVKGELEEALRGLAFDALTVARPSLLEGHRAEFRLGEFLALKLAPLTPAPWKPVHVSQVARGLWASAHQPLHGVRILHNTDLRSQPLAPDPSTS